MTMKILMTGGTGLIGSALTASLKKDGYQISVVSRTPDRVGAGLNAISWDLDKITQEINTSNIVINLAGESIAGASPLSMRWTDSRKIRIRSSRTQAGKILLQAIQQSTRRPEILIQASAIGYYGNLGEQPAVESTPPGTDFLAEICQSWEDSTSGVEQLGVRRIVTRFGLVLSRDGGLLPLLALPFFFNLGGPLGSGIQPMSWIHIADVIQSYRYFINNASTHGVYNLTAPTPVQNRIFSTALARSLNRSCWLKIPASILRSALGEASTLALDGREVLPRRLLESGFNFQFKLIDNALKNLYQ